MTMVHVNINGHLRNVLREDAVKLAGRLICPTTSDTKWVSTWEEAKAAGMEVCFNEDQTEIELRLPAPYKFGIRFQRED